MMKVNWLRVVGIMLLVFSAVVIVLAMTGCAQSEPSKSREQVWIETHPTSAGLFGECREFDGELCDDDPYDLDDLGEVEVRKPSTKPKVVKSTTPVKPKPAPTRRR